MRIEVSLQIGWNQIILFQCEWGQSDAIRFRFECGKLFDHTSMYLQFICTEYFNPEHGAIKLCFIKNVTSKTQTKQMLHM
jgi:hypothetical protein